MSYTYIAYQAPSFTFPIVFCTRHTVVCFQRYLINFSRRLKQFFKRTDETMWFLVIDGTTCFSAIDCYRKAVYEVVAARDAIDA